MIAACLSEDERILSLTNVALLGSSRMKMDYDTLITDKQRYLDMFSRLPGRNPDLADNHGHAMQSISGSPDSRGPIKIQDPVDSWGGCGLQATFSANDLQAACRLHDQLVPLGPLMLALSAATPMYKGRLVATDTRWRAMCWSGDDRTSSEKSSGLHPRLGCTPMYLEETPSAQQMNDRALKSADGPESDLYKSGVPTALATYFAHILGRAPLIDTTCMHDSDVSISAQDTRAKSLYTHMSTWWPHVRLKLPALSNVGGSLPWLIEFRPMEAQPSDMESAALVIAMRILQQTIQHFDLDLKIPISAVEENMNRASDHNAATDQIFQFAVRSVYSGDGQLPLSTDGQASMSYSTGVVMAPPVKHGLGC